ncbi:NAD(P)/FAD-dependent oxidoreductase [Arthrobacter tumbae]|uniref:phytoene desaturase family protein n=1 Tax=Arthrobacter tumbae TaxID=163874 RepID=UPI00195E3A78|nr:NAD(P)/FAD-dependent oxidoreductase [Arthrobacter tumbae]MBM7781366.1 phytoene dehydrogenase-like protein [Arthrobacter tumbae]
MADVAIVGAGPNGLAAGVVMARAGLSVEVFEAERAIGGGSRTMELLEPDHVHDVCSAVHPMALASPFFREFGLADRIPFVVPQLSYANPLDDGRAGLAYRDLGRTAVGLGRDGQAWRRLMRPLVQHIDGVVDTGLNQFLRIPRHPVAAAVLGLRTLEQGSGLWNLRFSTEEAAALFTGVAAHAVAPLPTLAAAGAGLTLGALAHSVGWPIPVGGSQALVNAMAEDIQAHGGVIHTARRIESVGEFDGARAVLLDVSPSAAGSLAGDRLPQSYVSTLDRFRYGDGACKVDFILSGPVPWANEEVRTAGTVHAGGTRAEVAASEADVAAGRHPEKPYVLVSQPSLFDSSRAPHGRHVLWTYCHVPNGSTQDMTEAIVRQIERFAPGFRDVVVRSHVMTAADLQQYNANYVGGDFSGGAVTIPQLLARPSFGPNPWRMPAKGLYLCSASTPPGPGVHGMGGYHAARLALEDVFGLPMPDLSPAT